MVADVGSDSCQALPVKFSNNDLFPIPVAIFRPLKRKLDYSPALIKEWGGF